MEMEKDDLTGKILYRKKHNNLAWGGFSKLRK